MTEPQPSVPVDLTAEEAREAAERELADPIYHQDDPSLLGRGLKWLLTELGELLRRAEDASPGGYAGLVAIAVLAVLAVVAIRLQLGPIARTATSDSALFDQAPRSAAEHRATADAHAADGAWADAVRERLRAIVRGLEERDLLEARPGRTADEAAAEAGRVLLACATGLREAAELFDEVWYGGRAATAWMDERLRAVDAEVARNRPSPPERVGATR